jgi:hypothetical protein
MLLAAKDGIAAFYNVSTMISDIDREKIAKLPTWARNLIGRLELAGEPMLAECVKLRREHAVLAERAKSVPAANEALMEILRCASRGGGIGGVGRRYGCNCLRSGARKPFVWIASTSLGSGDDRLQNRE